MARAIGASSRAGASETRSVTSAYVVPRRCSSREYPASASSVALMTASDAASSARPCSLAMSAAVTAVRNSSARTKNASLAPGASSDARARPASAAASAPLATRKSRTSRAFRSTPSSGCSGVCAVFAKSTARSFPMREKRSVGRDVGSALTSRVASGKGRTADCGCRRSRCDASAASHHVKEVYRFTASAIGSPTKSAWSIKNAVNTAGLNALFGTPLCGSTIKSITSQITAP